MIRDNVYKKFNLPKPKQRKTSLVKLLAKIIVWSANISNKQQGTNSPTPFIIESAISTKYPSYSSGLSNLEKKELFMGSGIDSPSNTMQL